MTNAPTQVFTDQMQVLFGVGTCAGLTDGQLLERFLAGRDEAGDLAFETLVTRHGPMVMRVCHNMLEDPYDVHDAFQAVFLVLLLKKLLIAACTFLPIALAALGGGVLLARRIQAQDQKPSATVSVPKAPQAAAKESPPTDDVDRLAQQLLEAARKRLEAQRAYYLEGRITLDRFLDASKHLEVAELRVAKTDADRLAARNRHVYRTKEIEIREQAELKDGRGTVADVSEAHERRLEAELTVMLSQRQAGEMAALLQRVSELERKVEQLQNERERK